jgi:hypothetical protein
MMFHEGKLNEKRMSGAKLNATGSNVGPTWSLASSIQLHARNVKHCLLFSLMG